MNQEWLAPKRTHHLLRRRARRRKHQLEYSYPQFYWRVESTLRGPFGWRTVRCRRRTRVASP